MQYRCSLSVHDESVSEADVILNHALFPPDAFVAGDVVQITAVDDHHVLNARTPSHQNYTNADQQGRLHGQKAALNSNQIHEPPDIQFSGSNGPDLARGYLFKVDDAGPEMLPRFPDIQVCFGMLLPSVCRWLTACCRYQCLRG